MVSLVRSTGFHSLSQFIRLGSELNVFKSQMKDKLYLAVQLQNFQVGIGVFKSVASL
jgi:hypothetical protein